MPQEENSLAQVKASILQLLARRGEPLQLDELVKVLEADGVADERIKAALWALISESAVELTPAYLIKAGVDTNAAVL